MNRLELVALSPARLDAFSELLSRGEFGGCFCAVWRHHGEDWAARCADPARPNFEHTARDVAAGLQTGFLVLQDGRLVGWTGAGPKSAFPLLATKLGSRLSEVPGAWVIGCVAVAAASRGTGLASRVVREVVALARRAGAPAVEAYPTRPWDEPRSYRGAEATYRREGFEVVAKEPDGASEILLMRLALEV